ncbi:MAG: Ig-like domain-containing protein [Phototrophicaceae bacterium]
MSTLKRLLLCSTLLLAAGCNLGAAAPETPIPTPDVPVVEFLYPPNNSTVLEGTDLTLDVVARDDSVGVSRLEIYLNDVLLREVELADYTVEPIYRVQVNWRADGAGLHALTAIAFRPDGTPSDEGRVTLEVVPRPTPTP